MYLFIGTCSLIHGLLLLVMKDWGPAIGLIAAGMILMLAHVEKEEQKK